MPNITVRARLLLLSGFLLTILLASSAYIGHQLATSRNVLKEQDSLQESLNTATAALREFGELKYWLADLNVSWLIESEKEVTRARENLDRQLKILAKLAPGDVSRIEHHIDDLINLSMQATDAYIDKNRVLGNSLQANARLGIQAVDTALLDVTIKLANQAKHRRDSTISSADKTLMLGSFAVVAASVLAVAFTYFTLRSIIPSLKQIVCVMNEVTNGRPYIRVPGCQRGDEIGDIARAVENSRRNLIRIKGMKAKDSSFDSLYR
jgi:HAMP domain-containing protein